MQFLVITRRRTEAFPPEAWTAERIEAEGQRVRELYMAGLIRSIWRRKDMPGATVLFEAASEEEVRAALATLPLAQLDMVEFPIVIQLEPYPGFGPR